MYLEVVGWLFKAGFGVVVIAVLIFGPAAAFFWWLDVVERGDPLRWVPLPFVLVVYPFAVAAIPIVGEWVKEGRPF